MKRFKRVKDRGKARIELIRLWKPEEEEKIREWLESSGFRKNDINAAITIAEAIEALDEMVFPEEPAPVWLGTISTINQRRIAPAGYIPSKDFYVISVRKAKSSLMDLFLDRYSMQAKATGQKKLFWKMLRIVFEETYQGLPLIEASARSMAAHEVRHRWQHFASEGRFKNPFPEQGPAALSFLNKPEEGRAQKKLPSLVCQYFAIEGGRDNLETIIQHEKLQESDAILIDTFCLALPYLPLDIVGRIVSLSPKEISLISGIRKIAPYVFSKYCKW